MTNKEAQIALANLKLYISGGGAVDRSTNKAIDMAIKALEKPKLHLIPVTERLPKIGEYVLCMTRQRYRGRFHVCRYVDKDKYINHPYFDWQHNGFPDAVAWMPLPEEWKGDK